MSRNASARVTNAMKQNANAPVTPTSLSNHSKLNSMKTMTLVMDNLQREKV